LLILCKNKELCKILTFHLTIWVFYQIFNKSQEKTEFFKKNEEKPLPLVFGSPFTYNMLIYYKGRFNILENFLSTVDKRIII